MLSLSRLKWITRLMASFILSTELFEVASRGVRPFIWLDSFSQLPAIELFAAFLISYLPEPLISLICMDLDIISSLSGRSPAICKLPCEMYAWFGFGLNLLILLNDWLMCDLPSSLLRSLELLLCERAPGIPAAERGREFFLERATLFFGEDTRLARSAFFSLLSLKCCFLASI